MSNAIKVDLDDISDSVLCDLALGLLHRIEDAVACLEPGFPANGTPVEYRAERISTLHRLLPAYDKVMSAIERRGIDVKR